MNITNIIEKVKKETLEYSSQYPKLNTYLDLIVDLYNTNEEINNGDISKVDKFLKIQLEELKLRKKLSDGGIGAHLNHIMGSLPIKEGIMDKTIGLDTLDPNIVFKLLNSLSKDFIDNDLLNEVSGKYLKYMDMKFLDADERNIVALGNGINSLNTLDKDSKKKLLEKVKNLKIYTSKEDEMHLSQYASKENQEKISSHLNISEKTKAYAVMLMKIGKDIGDQFLMPELIADIKKNNPDPESDRILSEISEMDPKTLDALYSESIDLGIDIEMIDSFMERVIVNNLETTSDLMELLSKANPDDILEGLEGFTDALDVAIDGSSGGSYLVAKTLYGLIPNKYKEKVPMIQKYEYFKEELKEKILGGDNIQKVRDWLESKLGTIALNHGEISSGLSNQYSRSLLKIVSRIGEQDGILNQSLGEELLSSAFLGTDREGLIKESKESVEKRIEVFSTLIDGDLKYLESKDRDYLKGIFIDNKTPNLKILEEINKKVKNNTFYNPEDLDENNTYNLGKEKISELISKQKYSVDKINQRFEREVFVGFIVSQIEKPSVPGFKKEIYVDSLMGKNHNDILSGFLALPDKDADYKKMFLSQSKEDIEKMIKDKDIDETLGKESLEAISIMENIVSVKALSNSSDFIFTNEKDFKKYFDSIFVIPMVNNVLREDSQIVKSLKKEFNNSIDTLILKFNGGVYRNDLKVENENMSPLKTIMWKDLGLIEQKIKDASSRDDKKVIYTREESLVLNSRYAPLEVREMYRVTQMELNSKEIGNSKDVTDFGTSRFLKKEDLERYIIENKDNLSLIDKLLEDKYSSGVLKEIILDKINNKDFLIKSILDIDDFMSISGVNTTITSILSNYSIKLMDFEYFDMGKKYISDMDPNMIRLGMVSNGFGLETMHNMIATEFSSPEEENLVTGNRKINLINEIIRMESLEEENDAIEILTKLNFMEDSPSKYEMNFKSISIEELKILALSSISREYLKYAIEERSIDTKYNMKFDNALDVDILDAIVDGDLLTLNELEDKRDTYSYHQYVLD